MSTFAHFQDRFANLVPELQRMAKAHFRHLDPEKREESVQNALGLAWKFYARLIEKGRGDEVKIRSCLWYAIQQTKAQRTVQGKGDTKPKCIYDHARKGCATLNHVDLTQLVSKRTSVFDSVSFNVDVSAFLSTLSDRQRSITMDLMNGETTSECAKRYGVTSAAISQWRARFRDLYEQFVGC